MPPALLIVDASINPAVEEEWNAWYDTQHLPEILACPYFESGARYMNDDGERRRYLTVYMLSSVEAVSTPEFGEARGWAKFKDEVQATTRLYVRVKGTQHGR